MDKINLDSASKMDCYYIFLFVFFSKYAMDEMNLYPLL